MAKRVDLFDSTYTTSPGKFWKRSAKKHSVRTLARIVGIRSRNMTVSFRGLICCPSITFLKSLAVPAGPHAISPIAWVAELRESTQMKQELMRPLNGRPN